MFEAALAAAREKETKKALKKQAVKMAFLLKMKGFLALLDNMTYK